MHCFFIEFLVIFKKFLLEYFDIIKNENKSVDVFTKRAKSKSNDFKRMELDLIISGIESAWVENV